MWPGERREASPSLTLTSYKTRVPLPLMNADNTFTQTPVTAAADKARSGNLLVVEKRRPRIGLRLNIVKFNLKITWATHYFLFHYGNTFYIE